MFELKRKFYAKLMAWKTNHHNECLLVKGARQVGKTFIIEKFGREQYESFFSFNFVLDPQACGIFDGSLKADDVLKRISAYDATHRIVPGRTLVFLDEIQECANARTALKSLAVDGRCDVIASGSLLGIKYRNKKSRELHEPKSIPVGYERQMEMHSLDFEEFLWARGVTEEAIGVLRECFVRRSVVPEAVNGRFGGLLREYLLTGGMPAVVKAFCAAGEFGPVQGEQEKILSSYVDDIHKYADAVDIPKIVNCYRAIPRTLAKDNRKFKYSEIEKGGSERKYGSAVDWLEDSALALKARNVTTPAIPLNAYVREGWFKMYLSDVGLLSALFGSEAKRLLYSGKLTGSAKGGIYENFVAGELVRKGLPLLYWKTLDGTREVEFALERDGGVVPVEVKSHNGPTISLNDMLARDDVPYGFKFIDGNVGVSGKKIALPHYMAMFV